MEKWQFGKCRDVSMIPFRFSTKQGLGQLYLNRNMINDMRCQGHFLWLQHNTALFLVTMSILNCQAKIYYWLTDLLNILMLIYVQQLLKLLFCENKITPLLT